MQKDLNEKRSCKTRFLCHSECCHMASKSSLFPGLLNHKMLQVSWKSIAFKRAVVKQSWVREENAIKTFKIHLPTAEQYLHQVNIMLLELDLRMLLYFFQKIISFIVKIMFELLYILQNWSFSPNCVIMRFFADYALRCGKMSIVQNCTST